MWLFLLHATLTRLLKVSLPCEWHLGFGDVRPVEMLRSALAANTVDVGKQITGIRTWARILESWNGSNCSLPLLPNPLDQTAQDSKETHTLWSWHIKLLLLAIAILHLKLIIYWDFVYQTSDLNQTI